MNWAENMLIIGEAKIDKPLVLYQSSPESVEMVFVHCRHAIQYQFDDGNRSLSGSGFAQFDKGWYDKESSAGMIYTMGLLTNFLYVYRLELALPLLNYGRVAIFLKTTIFYPAIGNVSVKREYDSCNGDFKLEMDKLTYKLVLEAKLT